MERDSPPSPIHVTADDREADAGVIEALESFEEVELAVERMPLGDYEVDGKLLFERKTLPDLTISITDGRLFSQAIRLAQCSKPAALILEGTAADLKDCGMTRESIQGALIHLTLVLGIPILRSISPAETARLMLYAARQIRVVAQGGIQRAGYRPKGKRKRQLFILQGLPGIGPKRAEELLNTFGSIESVLSATEDQLARVPGIGPETAERIRGIVSEPAAKYGTEIEDLDV